MYYPHPNQVDFPNAGAIREYHCLYSFYANTKAQQRIQLSCAGLPVPRTYTEPCPGQSIGRPNGYIVRPLRHSGGRAYRITADRNDFESGTEYIQEIFPKIREWRIISVYGRHILTLLKRRPGTVSTEEAWNHENGAFFVTIRNPWNNHLLARFPEISDRLRSFEPYRLASIVGVDIMESLDAWTICEFNACPGITIPQNLTEIGHAARSAHDS